jgi:hypothetical protein
MGALAAEPGGGVRDRIKGADCLSLSRVFGPPFRSTANEVVSAAGLPFLLVLFFGRAEKRIPAGIA